MQWEYTYLQYLQNQCWDKEQTKHFYDNYKDYLKSDRWKQRVAWVRAACDNTCEHCGIAPMVDCHHRSYERLYCETRADLMGVCRECHKILHMS